MTTETMQAQHTAGPWEICDYRDVYAGNVHIAKLRYVGEGAERTDGPDYDFPETEANARLIAAAPDLLAACEAALEWLEDTLAPCDPDCECVVHPVAAAIAKAKGQAS